MTLIVVAGLKREAQIVGSDAVTTLRGLGIDEALRRGGKAVISFGLCGALDPSLGLGNLIIGDAVVDGRQRFECDTAWSRALAAAMPQSRSALVWADGKMITSAGQKTSLFTETAAAVVDMESHVAASAAADFRVPFAIVRAVSDDAFSSIPKAAQVGFAEDGSVRPARVALQLLSSRFDELGDLMTLARGAGEGLKTLRAAWPTVSRVSAPFATGGSR